MSAPGSTHFLTIETCGLAVSARICVRRNSHSPKRKLGSSTGVLSAPDVAGDAAVAAGFGASAVADAGSWSAAHGAAPQGSRKRTATALSVFRGGQQTGIIGNSHGFLGNAKYRRSCSRRT